jgi:hypothetical protein
MNYFAHGLNHLEDPYFLAGTAVPDWLSIMNRRVRALSRLAEQWLEDTDSMLAAVAAGVVRHHDDDAWFHQTAAFAELSLSFTASIREFLAGDDGFRPSFLGHILVEILVDATLIDAYPAKLDTYYRALETVDAAVVTAAVGRMSTGSVQHLLPTIELFRTDRFLYDYADDAKLLQRLNRVMSRVNLAELPQSLLRFLPGARRDISQRLAELLAKAPPDTNCK